MTINKKNLSGNESLVNKLCGYLPRLILLLCVLWLSACASTANIDLETQEPARVEDRVVVDGEVIPLPEESTLQSERLPTRQVSPVVRRLIASAETQKSQGNNDAAANSLERALRIEPRNALLWSRLAEVRYAQQNWQQSIQLAAKSNTLVEYDEELQRRNWFLMATAYDKLGDAERAQRYRDKLKGN